MALNSHSTKSNSSPTSHQMRLRPRPTRQPKRFSFSSDDSSSESDADSEAHPEPDEAVQCPWCGKSFATQKKLGIHVEYHRRQNTTVLKRLNEQKPRYRIDRKNRRKNGGRKSQTHEILSAPLPQFSDYPSDSGKE